MVPGRPCGPGLMPIAGDFSILRDGWMRRLALHCLGAEASTPPSLFHHCARCLLSCLLLGRSLTTRVGSPVVLFEQATQGPLACLPGPRESSQSGLLACPNGALGFSRPADLLVHFHTFLLLPACLSARWLQDARCLATRLLTLTRATLPLWDLHQLCASSPVRDLLASMLHRVYIWDSASQGGWSLSIGSSLF